MTKKDFPDCNKDALCKCGGIILADTEDWDTPLCSECYFSIDPCEFCFINNLPNCGNEYCFTRNKYKKGV